MGPLYQPSSTYWGHEQHSKCFYLVVHLSYNIYLYVLVLQPEFLGKESISSTIELEAQKESVSV